MCFTRQFCVVIIENRLMARLQRSVSKVMIVDTEEILDEVLGRMKEVLGVRYNDIPNIDLYVDQVTTFFNDKLKFSLRNGGEKKEKIITKTMINNYAKNELMPPPVKKKYSREHMMILIFIYYFKSFMSINDIGILLKPLEEEYFGNEGAKSLGEIYETIFGAGEERLSVVEEDLRDKFKVTREMFPDMPDEEAEYLRLFSYVCFLSYDVFVKKMLIERLIDEMCKEGEFVGKSGSSEKKKS